MVREYLLKHFDACKAIRPTVGQMTPAEKSGAARHECGSVRCITAFLGEENWSKSRVGRLLARFQARLWRDNVLKEESASEAS